MSELNPFMQQTYLLLVLLCIVSSTFAQTYTSTTTAPIRDNQYHRIPIVVSGLPVTIDTSFGLCSVCTDIVHTYDGDIDLWIISPAGDSIRLSNNQGGNGVNYTNTCFRMDAATPINSASAIAPFTGDFIPESNLNFLNKGIDPNGTWYFGVSDDAPGDSGHIALASLNFCLNPPQISTAALPCDLNNGWGCSCPDSTQDCDLLPDMTASHDYIVSDNYEQPGIIYVGNATPNIGWGPMEIRTSGYCWCDTIAVNCSTTICPNGNPVTEQLSQRIYHKNGGSITYHDTLTPGRMSYHPTHGHVHVDNWSEFTLRSADPNDPDARNWPIVARGSKISFCLINLGDCSADYGWCRDTMNNIVTMADIPNAPFGLVSGCGIEQGIYTGMLDIYHSSLPDMHIDLTGVCNGNYYIVSETDPDNNFIETNDDNNWVAVPITLSMQASPISSGFTVSQSGTSVICSNNNFDLQSFVWDFGDGILDSTSNPASHTYASAGTYTVTLKQTNGCGTYTSTQILVITGIGESADFSAKVLQAFPNPATNTTTINWLTTTTAPVQLEIFTINGERVAPLEQGTYSVGNHTTIIDFDGLNLANGNYIVRLSSSAYSAALRVAVVR
jgi:subtilisin-like proprotein convertase family protein